jgi:hypothetical protein
MSFKRDRRPTWRLVNFSCSVVAILILFMALLYTIFLLKMAGDRRFQRKLEQAVKLQKCKANLKELGKALERYKEGTGDYPDKLSQLLPLYLKTPNLLHCPNDPSPPDKISYQYIKPRGNDPKQIVIICNHHPNPLALHLNGELEVYPREKLFPSKNNLK